MFASNKKPTQAYSIRAIKTIRKQFPKYISNDLMYDILGSDSFVFVINVVIVKTVVTPRATLAWELCLSNQNGIHDIITIRVAGI